MKLSSIFTAGLIITTLGLFPEVASSLETNKEILISQFNVNVDVNVPIGKKPEKSDEQREFSGFSGKYAEYTDTLNGFKLKVPVEFIREDRGQTTTWMGPTINDSATIIAVNSIPLSGVSGQDLQQAYQMQYEKDAFYTNVTPLEIKFGDEVVPALRMSEINKQKGTRREKNPEDLHRWHLYVFGNDQVYNIIMSASFETFQDNKVQGVYEDTISSVELVAIEESKN